MATAGVPLWSTTAASNATADPAVNFAEGMAPSAVNDSARALMASVAKWRNDLYGITTGGTSTAFTVTTGSTFGSASDMSGAVFGIIPHTTSGAAPTLAVDGLTARNINVSTGVNVPTGALVSGTPYLVKYVHATTEFILLGSAGKILLAALDIIGGTSESSIAVDDTLPLYDLSNTSNRRMLVSDFLKVVNALTADASPDADADYVMTYDASASAAKKVLLANLPGRLPRGYIDGCILSNNSSDSTNDIDIAAGVCRDSTNAVDIAVAAMTKQLDANWVAGSGQGMRNSAAGITDTTYHIYAVAKADGTQDFYAHTSATVSTVLTALQAETGGADYVYARRVGSIIRASSAIVGFVQAGDYFRRKAAAGDVSAGNPGSSAVSRTLSVPLGIRVFADTFLTVINASTGVEPYSLLSDLDTTDAAPSQTVSHTGRCINAGGGATSQAAGVRVRTNTSGQIRSRLSASDANVSISIATIGWDDLRGKDE